MEPRIKDIKSSICDLPDKVLEHVLSFLSTKQAAQTSILSKRWRHLWSNVPVLRFDMDGDDYFHDMFVSAVFSALLCYRGNSLSRFQLALKYVKDDKVNRSIDMWLAFAHRKNVKELHLDLCALKLGTCALRGGRIKRLYDDDDSQDDTFSNGNHYDTDSSDGGYDSDSSGFDDYGDYSGRYAIPRSTLCGVSLRSLRLKHCKITSRAECDFRFLVNLHLTKVSAPQGRLQNLISSCPLLGSLQVEGCSSITYLRVSCLNLKRMVLKCCHKLNTLEINAPSLRTFEFVGNLPEGFSFVCSPKISRISILLCPKAKTYENNWATTVRDFVGKFIHAKSLMLSAVYIEHLEMARDFSESISPSLVKLKRLELTGRGEHDMILALASLLKSSPSLEELSIYLIPQKMQITETYRQSVEDLSYPDDSIACLQSSLKHIKIYRYRGYPLEARMVKFLLSRAMALEDFTIKGGKLSFPEHMKIYGSLFSWRANPSIKISYE